MMRDANGQAGERRRPPTLWRRGRRVGLVVALALIGAGLWGVRADGDPSGSLESLMLDFGVRPLLDDPPPISLPGLDGRRYVLESLKGRVGLLYFWATWCPYCTRELPSSVETLHRGFKDQGLTIWAINLSEPRALVAEWVKRKGLTIPVLLDVDGAVTQAYRVRMTPTVVLVDRAGQLVGRSAGAREWDTEGRSLITALLARHP